MDICDERRARAWICLTMNEGSGMERVGAVLTLCVSVEEGIEMK